MKLYQSESSLLRLATIVISTGKLIFLFLWKGQDKQTPTGTLDVTNLFNDSHSCSESRLTFMLTFEVLTIIPERRFSLLEITDMNSASTIANGKWLFTVTLPNVTKHKLVIKSDQEAINNICPYWTTITTMENACFIFACNCLYRQSIQWLIGYIMAP